MCQNVNMSNLVLPFLSFVIYAKVKQGINPFHATGLFLYPLNISGSGNLWFSDVFRKYRKRPVASNWLNKI